MTNFYINVAMGLGGNIALSSVITQIKEEFGDEYNFNVMSPYSDVFICNTSVNSVYTPQEARDFLFDAKEDENAKIIMHRLYDMQSFITKNASYKSAWYELLGITPKTQGNDLVSKFDTSKFPNVKVQTEQILKYIREQGYKDFIIINFEGSVSPLAQVPAGQDGKPDWSKVPDPYYKEPLARLYPREKASEFVKLFKEAHPKTAIINYTLPNQANYNVGELKFTAPYLVYYELAKLPECKGFVGIDSSGQHLLAGVTKAVVIWGHSINADRNGKIICNNFGYDYNMNIVQQCRRDDVLYFSMLGPSGARITYIEPKELLVKVDEWLYDKRKVNE